MTDLFCEGPPTLSLIVGSGTGVPSVDTLAGSAVADPGAVDSGSAEVEGICAGSGAGAGTDGTGRCAAAASNVLLMRDHPEKVRSVD